MSTNLVTLADDGIATTTSLIIAAGTQIQHKNVLELIRNNVADFEEFGRVAFETQPLATPGGPQLQTVAVLNEEQATLLMTYMRNSEVVRDFKKRLVHGFYELRRAALPAIPQTYAEALRAAADHAERAERAEAERDTALEWAAELEAPANAYNELVAIKSDLKVGDAAKILSRDPHIRDIGQNRLFKYMHSINWCFRNRDNGRWCAYQSAVDRRWLVEKPGDKYYDQRAAEYRLGDPVVLVTPKGLEELHKRLGGGRQLTLVDPS